MVGAGGQLLERSIVDRMVGAPERLVFEGAPILEPPLAQDLTSRQPIAVDGDVLDTVAACPPLTIVEQSRLQELIVKEAQRLAPEKAKAREHFVATQARRLADRSGIDLRSAERIIQWQCAGILLPDIVLPFDDPDLTGTTVADVLGDPGRFEGATLADPLEGVEYGLCKAKVMRHADGTPWIHSFAHGRTAYELKYDARAARAVLANVAAETVADELVRFVLAGNLGDAEIEELVNIAHQRTGIGKRALIAKLKATRREKARHDDKEERNRRLAERQDPRPLLPAPAPDAEWLPQMAALNDLLGKSQELEPPARDMDGVLAAVYARPLSITHLLTSAGADAVETDETRLPPPDQPLLTRLSETEAAEVIERYIQYVDDDLRPVHLAAPFVKHFHCRHDGLLPTVRAVATMPIIMPDGTILAGRGLDRERGVVFRILPQILQLLPARKDCTPAAVARAMNFLTHQWLVDVNADYAGRCIVIALALSLIERLALPERPAFLITAGQRGGGKTTTAHMIAMAVLGHRAAAVAWSNSEEERRKALFSFLGAGMPMIAWDNIARGTAISCPSLEKALTTETYTDRILRETNHRTVPASTIMLFTGNNITARGDLASRTITCRIAVNRPDPENRDFKHPDPIGWTEAHRADILRALFVVLLGNPRLAPGKTAPPAETRFKTWWHLVGSAVEYAAKLVADEADWHVTDQHKTCPAVRISFKDLFLLGEDDEEQTSALVTVIEEIARLWPNGCTARDVANHINSAGTMCFTGVPPNSDFKAALEAASGKAIKVPTPTVVSWRLKSLVDAPAKLTDGTAALRYVPNHAGGNFRVSLIR